MKFRAYLIYFILILTGNILPQNSNNSIPSLDSALVTYYSNDLPKAYDMLGAVIKSDSNNVDAVNYYSETCRRLGYFDESFLNANKALKISGCSSFALSILGDLYSPQYSSWEKTDYDSAWAYQLKAVECNKDEAQAYLSIWTLALQRGNQEMENKALENLYRLKFFTGAVLSFNRWMLKAMPVNSILITNGDMDTYPALALQLAENLREDVVIVNCSLLEKYSYADLMSKRYNIPLPYTSEEAKKIKPYYSDDSTTVRYLAYDIIEYWKQLQRENELGRPLSFAITVNKKIMPDQKELKMLGPAFLFGSFSPGNKCDEETYDAAMTYLSGKDFNGDVVSDMDRSPVRHAAYKEFIKMNIIQSYLYYAVNLNRLGQKDKAINVFNWISQFEKDSESGKSIRDRIRKTRQLINPN